MRTMAVKLHPKTIIIGFYFGNDLLDVYNVARFNSRWSQYAILGDTKIEGPAFVFPRVPRKFLGGLRDWLSKNSVLYVLITKFPIFEFIREGETTNRMADEAASLIPFHDDKHNVIFNLSARSRFLDMRDSRIQLAMEITKRVLSDMQQVSKKESIRLIVALLPTKERVYSNLLKRAGYIDKYLPLAEAIDQEDLARGEILEYLRELEIEALDLLPQLEMQVANRDLFPLTNPHPNKDGYSVIANTVNNYLNTFH
jgi:hypothetical protein